MDEALTGQGAQTVVAVDKLRKTYARGKIVAVDEVSFAIPRGTIFGLIGPDGAGKTSIIQMLAGVLKADDGTGSVAGRDAINRPESVKPIVGYMPQGLGLNLYDTLSVEENLEFFRDLRRIPPDVFAVNRERLLEMTRLAPFVNRLAGQLSGGMRQKLALLCTLVHLPDILLLDEPTTGVDPISRRDFWNIVVELVAERRVTVLLTTAYMDEAERCQRIALLHQGRVIDQGDPMKITEPLEGRLFSILGASGARAAALARATPGIESCHQSGRNLQLLTHDGLADARKAAARIGTENTAVVATPPSLEDVFIHRLAERQPADVAGPVSLSPALTVESPVVPRSNRDAVVVEELTCRFGDFVAVDRVSMTIGRGEIVGLLGPNGAGKTTLIKMICGLIRMDGGRAEIDGIDVAKGNHELRHHFGYMSQRFSLYPDLDVRGNLTLYAGLYGLKRSQRTERINALLEAVELESYADRPTRALPLGLRQRLALGTALLHNPPILFLDEPTSGVDPVARRRFWDTVHSLAEDSGVTVLVSTHYMDEAEHCDRLGLMASGRLIALDAPQVLTDRAAAAGGPLLTVHAEDFARTFQLVREHIPSAMLYGRRIQWQSTAPAEEQARIATALTQAGIDAAIEQANLSMEETFVHFIRSAENRTIDKGAS